MGTTVPIDELGVKYVVNAFRHLVEGFRRSDAFIKCLKRVKRLRLTIPSFLFWILSSPVLWSTFSMKHFLFCQISRFKPSNHQVCCVFIVPFSLWSTSASHAVLQEKQCALLFSQDSSETFQYDHVNIFWEIMETRDVLDVRHVL